MNYEGKLYGKVGNKYFYTGYTTDDWDKLELQVITLEADLSAHKIALAAYKSIKNKCKSDVKCTNCFHYPDGARCEMCHDYKHHEAIL